MKLGKHVTLYSHVFLKSRRRRLLLVPSPASELDVQKDFGRG